MFLAQNWCSLVSKTQKRKWQPSVTLESGPSGTNYIKRQLSLNLLLGRRCGSGDLDNWLVEKSAPVSVLSLASGWTTWNTVSERQLSEREQQLLQKSAELLALQKEADSMRADFSLLRNQFLTERKKAEKQVASLKEVLKTQRSELEKNLLVSTHRPARQLVRRGGFQFLTKTRFPCRENKWPGNPVPNPAVAWGTSVYSLCLKLMVDFACVWAQP